MKNIRLDFLDSLRGFAAVFVVLNHFTEAYDIGNSPQFSWIKFSPLHFFYNGPAAVSLFFVLSGYVLALSLDRAREFDLFSFYKKRIFRVWPAFLVAFAASYFLYRNYILVQTTPMNTAWIEEFWRHPLSIKQLLNQIMLLEIDSDMLIPQSWTLHVIMQFSFLMPFLYIILKKVNSIAFLILNLVLYFIFNGSYFIFHFSFGIFMAVNQQQILDYYNVLKSRYKGLIILVTIGLFTYRYTIPVYYQALFGAELPFFGSGGAMRLISGVGSFCVLLYCLSSLRIQKWLNAKPLIAFGRLSYSIYLTHFMVLIYVVPLFISRLNNAGIYNRHIIFPLAIAVLLLITTIAAYLLRKCVEVPFNKLGHTLFNNKRKKQADSVQQEEAVVLT